MLVDLRMQATFDTLKYVYKDFNFWQKQPLDVTVNQGQRGSVARGWRS